MNNNDTMMSQIDSRISSSTSQHKWAKSHQPGNCNFMDRI